MTVRVGVIGAGIMGADHVQTLDRWVGGAEVVCVADVDSARAEAAVGAVAGSAVPVRATDDPYALISDPGVDAVVIASHDSTHADLCVAGVSAGKPVMCEKPLAPTLPDCVRVVEAELQAVGADGLPLISLGFMRRFDPGYLRLRSAITDGELGPPVLVHCVSRGVTSGPGTTSESSVTQSAIHEFDIIPWLLGSPIVEVSWQAPRTSSQAEELQDPQLILLRTADGVLTTVEVFLNARYGYDIRCEVVGEMGAASLAEPVRLITDTQLRRWTPYAADWRPRFAEAYRLELQAWIDAVSRGQRTPLADAAGGLTANAVADAVISSMREGGRTVAVRPPQVHPSAA